MNYYKIIENKNLKKYNTFNINVKARFFVSAGTLPELKEIILSQKYNKLPVFIIGGGSNLLFTSDFNGLVIEVSIKNIQKYKETQTEIYLKVGAGENWDDFIDFCVKNNYYGAENMSYIPGRVGASPVQNVGAYGVEAKDIIHKVETIEIATGNVKIFSNKECKFAYRDSIFKNEFKNKYIVINVYFRLSKIPDFKLEYGNLKNYLKKFSEINLENIRNSIIEIRKSKLPLPEDFPSAGSFFKNPIIRLGIFIKLKEKYPNLVSYFVSEENIKLAAGQLIDMCGWKGKRIKNVGTYQKQALVIVNYSEATGKEILEFAGKIQKAVEQKFGINLDMELTIVGE